MLATSTAHFNVNESISHLRWAPTCWCQGGTMNFVVLYQFCNRDVLEELLLLMRRCWSKATTDLARFLQIHSTKENNEENAIKADYKMPTKLFNKLKWLLLLHRVIRALNSFGTQSCRVAFELFRHGRVRKSFWHVFLFLPNKSIGLERFSLQIGAWKLRTQLQ